ncbi:hypothetical protein [Brevundimonas sp. GCM10030266]|uniref:GAP1-N1 domain-containing protein n=1 Tax=Brevundimonas sp. GCM10030266 TaxID=3273386 RepID=UPI0036180BC4
MTSSAGVMWVDQVVHGYKHGHRQLAATLELDESSAATMLSLSDLLVEPGTVSTYLTGYPLRQANRFVLARTWLAPEMPRPGCVWTHSLIIDYAALARLEDPSRLNGLFRRPSTSLADTFTERVSVRLEADRGMTSVPEERLSNILGQLYAGAGRGLFPAGDQEEDEALALTAWRQMWPRLRRGFFFCTATATELRARDAECVLLFLASRADPPRMSKVSRSEGLELLTKDAPSQKPTSLRKFMARYAADLSAPRLSAFALAEIHSRLASARSEQAMADAIQFIAKALPAEDAKLLKSDLLLGKFRGSANRELVVRDFVSALEGFAASPNVLDTKLFADHLIQLVTNREVSLETAIQSIGTPTVGTLGDVALQVIATELPAAFLGKVDVGEDLKIHLASLNPALYALPAFWPNGPADRQGLLQAALSAGCSPLDLFHLLKPTISGPEVAHLLRRGDSKVASAVLAGLPESPALVEAAALWIPALKDQPASFAVGVERLTSHPEILEVLAAEVTGSPLERAFSENLFLRLAKLKRGSDLPPPMLSVIALVRALERQTANPGELIRYGLDATVQRSLQRTLPSLAQLYLDRSLPPGGYLTDHPLLARLIREIVGRYVDGDRPDQWILDASDDLHVLHRLLSDVQDRLYGRRLLKGLQERTKRKRSGVPKAKSRILDDVLKPFRFW